MSRRNPTVQSPGILEKVTLSLTKNQISSYCTNSSSCTFFLLFKWRRQLFLFVLLSFNNSNNANHVPKLGFFTFDIISAVHFDHPSTHATYVTWVHVMGDFCHIICRFTAPDTQCLEKLVNSDCLGIQRNSAW